MNGSTKAISCVAYQVSPFYINHREQRGPTHGLKQRIYSAQWKYELPGFTILGKDVSGQRKYIGFT